ncbi:hypothetical protein ANTPLA_LOCUS5605 [Anthophora plagiata]
MTELTAYIGANDGKRRWCALSVTHTGGYTNGEFTMASHMNPLRNVTNRGSEPPRACKLFPRCAAAVVKKFPRGPTPTRTGILRGQIRQLPTTLFSVQPLCFRLQRESYWIIVRIDRFRMIHFGQLKVNFTGGEREGVVLWKFSACSLYSLMILSLIRRICEIKCSQPENDD